MDANGLKFVQLAAESDWTLEPEVTWQSEHRALALRSVRAGLVEPAAQPSTEPTFEARVRSVPQTVDAFDTYAYHDATAGEIVAAGAAPGHSTLRVLSATEQLSDLAVGHRGTLYLVIDGELRVLDLRRSFAEQSLAATPLQAFRVAPRPDGGAWVLDRENRALWLVTGAPVAESGYRAYDGDVFRPVPDPGAPPEADPENVAALRLERWLDLESDPVAIACSPNGDTVVLFRDPTGPAYVRRVSVEAGLGARLWLSTLRRPFSVGWLREGVIGVLVELERASAPGGCRVEFVPFEVPQGNVDRTLTPQGGYYPLAHYSGGGLAHVLRFPTRYAAQSPSATEPELPRKLVPLSAPVLASQGHAESARVLDAGQVGAVWHRLFVEATIPEECGILVHLAASDERSVPPADADYHPHWFGAAPDDFLGPVGSWCSEASEVPFSPGFVRCASNTGRSGLFNVLVQRTGRRVSRVVGRYLWVRVTLAGTGRTSPELFALRAYASRFSYVQNYLPQVYQEQLVLPESEAASPTPTPEDFLERFVALFESVLTPLEDRVAQAHLLTDPQSAPEAALGWLSQWVGLVFDRAYPEERRRAALARCHELHRWHGTLRGLELAIDVLTDGALSRGEVLVVEDFRLRRTFSTILGADLADEDDPLLGGVAQSGNSLVGDTLILGKEHQREFLSLFRETIPELPTGGSIDEWVNYFYQRAYDPVIIDGFLDRFAHRLTVLVHREIDETEFKLIQRTVELEAPVHLQVRVERARHPFIVGLAALVGIDTFAREPEAPRGVRLDESRLGTSDFLLRVPSLDPRLSGDGGGGA